MGGASGGHSTNGTHGIYERLGVRPVVNGIGTVTRLGGSLMPPEVLQAMLEGARQYVPLEELQAAAGTAPGGPDPQRGGLRHQRRGGGAGLEHGRVRHRGGRGEDGHAPLPPAPPRGAPQGGDPPLPADRLRLRRAPGRGAAGGGRPLAGRGAPGRRAHAAGGPAGRPGRGDGGRALHRRRPPRPRRPAPGGGGGAGPRPGGAGDRGRRRPDSGRWRTCGPSPAAGAPRPGRRPWPPWACPATGRRPRPRSAGRGPTWPSSPGARASAGRSPRGWWWGART